MHELGIAMDVLDAATQRAEGARIKRITLEIGALAAVLPDALLFCFDLAAEGTSAEGATLEVRQVPGRAQCRACQGMVELQRPFGVCACGCSDLTWMSGNELRIVRLEVH
jgi:hydrogenase nickel incorporation protein HypA/HybF